MSAPTASSSPSARRICMRALPIAELPGHPDLTLQHTNGSPPELREFLSSILTEAEEFMTTYLPSKFHVKSKGKSSPPSAATVELLAHNRPSSTGTGPSEAWFARTSTHENMSKHGTATWDEMDGHLRVNHSKHEAEYTPGVQEAHKVLDWNDQLGTDHGTIDSWSEVQLVMMEMVHHIPAPLNNRVFSVIVLTAKRTNEFLVVQIPVETKGISHAKYSSPSSSVTPGMYCSIERGQLIEDNTKTEWQMATASDAKGVLPMWMQKLGVPGAVVKDVGFFMDWISKTRQSKA